MLVLSPACPRPSGHPADAPGNDWLAGAWVSQTASINNPTVYSEQAWEPWEGKGLFPWLP